MSILVEQTLLWNIISSFQTFQVLIWNFLSRVKKNLIFVQSRWFFILWILSRWVSRLWNVAFIFWQGWLIVFFCTFFNLSWDLISQEIQASTKFYFFYNRFNYFFEEKLGSFNVSFLSYNFHCRFLKFPFAVTEKNTEKV